MRQFPFITVEGPIGAGKTSLATKLSSTFHFHLLKEIAEENPFLEKFYQNIEEWSFQTEMFFLCNRYKQLEEIKNVHLKNNKPVVADYHISKNMIFARRTLHGKQLDKYEKIYSILTADMPQPDIMVYLDASLDTLWKRIKKRGRPAEQNLQPAYLQQLAGDYRCFMDKFEQQHPEIPLIRLNGDELDFVQHHDDVEMIIKQVAGHLKKGGKSQ